MTLNQDIYTVSESAENLRMTESTIRTWILQKRLPVIRLGRKVFIRKETIEKILKDGLEAVSRFDH